MAAIPPWCRKLWGPWLHDAPPIQEEKVRTLAKRLSEQRPSRSAEENWFDAERPLGQEPWRHWIILFSGEKERSGWDWAELSLKVSVPLMILLIGACFNWSAKEREERAAAVARADSALSNYFKEMQPLTREMVVQGNATNQGTLGLARALTLATLGQLRTDDRGRECWQRGIVVRFLLDSGLNPQDGSLISLQGANLYYACLNDVGLPGVDLREAALYRGLLTRTNLSRANLSGAYMLGADLSGAYLMDADLSGADIREANLSGANLERIKWSPSTKWPAKNMFKGAKNIPPALKIQLGLP